MATAPQLQVLYRIYSSASPGGPFTIAKSGIPNIVDRSVYSGKVIVVIEDVKIPIPSGDYYYFKLTAVDVSDVESSLGSSASTEIRPFGVEEFHENESQERNIHTHIWDPTEDRWKKLSCTPEGKIPVDATINIDNITLGNVKVAARPDNTTLEWVLVDSGRRQIVCIDPNCKDRIDDYEEESNVAKDTETIMFTYSNVGPYFVEKVVCSGTSDAVFRFKINGTTRRTMRNSWNDRNVTFDFSTFSRKISAGATVTVTVEHSEVLVQDFEANLSGFTYSTV